MCPRLVKYKKEETDDQNTYGILPYDMYLFRRCLTYQTEKSTDTNRLTEIDMKYYSELFSEQTDKNASHPALFYDLNCSKESILMSITDYYYPYVKQNKIWPIRSTITRFESNGIVLEDGTFHEIDAIIYCTGYDKTISEFVDESFLKTVKYRKENYKETFDLYKCTFHPDLENMAFVGMSVGLFFPGAELQAKWACMAFSGKIELPDTHTMKRFIEKEERERSSKINQQYPYGDHLTLVDSIAAEMDLLPDFDELKRIDASTYDLFWNNGMFASNYVFKTNRDQALNLMKQAKTLKDKNYKFDKLDPKAITYTDVAKEFSKCYKFNDYLIRDL